MAGKAGRVMGMHGDLISMQIYLELVTHHGIN
jgi:hypothetical protein